MCRSLFQICTNFTDFLLPFSLLSNLLNFHEYLYFLTLWYMISTLLTKMLNQFLHFFSFLLSSSFFGKLSLEWNISNLSQVKTYPKKLVYFWSQSLVFQKPFMLLLIISSTLIVKPKNAKREKLSENSLLLLAFYYSFKSFLSDKNKFVLAINISKNSSQSKYKKYSHG